MENMINTPEELHSAYAKTASLRVLTGDYSGCRALRVLRRVWDVAPILFPELAISLTAGTDPREVCWDAAQLLSDIPGCWAAYRDARDCAML